MAAVVVSVAVAVALVVFAAAVSVAVAYVMKQYCVCYAVLWSTGLQLLVLPAVLD